jgi:hypothetical protein
MLTHVTAKFYAVRLVGELLTHLITKFDARRLACLNAD